MLDAAITARRSGHYLFFKPGTLTTVVDTIILHGVKPFFWRLKIFLMVLLGFCALEIIARIADAKLNFSTPVRWTLQSLVPESILDHEPKHWRKENEVLALRAPALSPPDSTSTLLGGLVISGAVGEVKWMPLAAKISHPGRKVVVLGESAAFGYPYPYEDAFASILGARLRAAGDWLGNLARPGMDSRDITLMMDTVYRLIDPDVLLVMIGNNEFIRWHPPGFYPSHEEFWSLAARLSSSRLISAILYVRLRQLSRGPQSRAAEADGFQPHRQLTGYRYAVDQLIQDPDWNQDLWERTREIRLGRFQRNLERIIEEAVSRDKEVVMLTLPLRYKLSPAWKHPQPLGNGEEPIGLFREMTRKFQLALAIGDVDHAAKISADMTTRWPQSAIPFYLKAVALEQAGSIPESLKNYARSRDLMVGNLGGITTVNNIIRRVAIRANVVLIDIENIFYEDAVASGVIDRLVDDDCHPNREGHRMIAAALEPYFESRK
jgi:lysophospholipase L1-like esterase